MNSYLQHLVDHAREMFDARRDAQADVAVRAAERRLTQARTLSEMDRARTELRIARRRKYGR